MENVQLVRKKTFIDPEFLSLREFMRSVVRVRRVGGEPETEADHFTKCGCGAWVDMRDPNQVLDHVGPHERLIGDH
jgi:hypothetical protein